MSRKREEKREQKRERARQLGVAGKDVPSSLLEHERVCEPKLVVDALDVAVRKRGFFESKVPLVVVVGLFVVDRTAAKTGARLVRQVRCDVGVVSAGVSVDVSKKADVVGDERVRYHRPGHFVVVALAAEAAAEAAAFDVSVLAGVDAAAIATDGALVVVGAFAAAGVVVDAVTTVKEALVVPLTSADGRFAAALRLHVKL